MRRFVAVPVPTGVRAALDAALQGTPEDWPGLRWTDPDGWHVTLAFLGELADEQLTAARGSIERAVHGTETCRLRLGEAGSFSGALWVSVLDRPADALSGLGERIQSTLVDAGMPVQQRRVRPHVTLARARGSRGRVPAGAVDALAQRLGDVEDQRTSWTCGAVELWSSSSAPGGRGYTRDASIALSG